MLPVLVLTGNSTNGSRFHTLAGPRSAIIGGVLLSRTQPDFVRSCRVIEPEGLVSADPAAARNLRELARINRWFGGPPSSIPCLGLRLRAVFLRCFITFRMTT
jgi:hypothetical protein